MVELRVNSPRIFFFSCLRAGGGMVKVMLVLALLVSLYFGGRWGFQKFFVENDEFIISKVPLTIMDTDRTPLFLDFKRIEETCGLQLSTSIFAVDTDDLEEKLQALPEITGAKVVRRMPGTLKISVTERMPVAWIECEVLEIEGRNFRKGRLVDENGVVFPCASLALWTYSENLPVVALPVAPEKGINSGDVVKDEGFDHALELAMLATGSLKDKWAVDRIEVRDSITLELVTLGGSQGTFSYFDLPRQLRHFSKLLKHAEKTGRILATANLIPEKNIPVTFVGHR